MLEFAQTAASAAGRWQANLSIRIQLLPSDVAAFQKYNSPVRFIGFPPSRPPIIDQSGILEATSN
jgi:lipid A disaccharide synthetase